MTEREKFLERWSRKKREAVDESSTESKPIGVEADKKSEADALPVTTQPEKSFDLENLPSLESITAETDIRDFLRPGVPGDLRREALRRAWSTDPGIRDFVGLAENSGDFNDPTSMAGFGPIEPGEVARLMAQYVLTPAPEKKAAPAPDQLADQHAGQAEAASETDSRAGGVKEGQDAKVDSAADAASQNQGPEPGSDTPPAGRLS